VSSSESVTRWINQIKDGDRAGVQKLLERYFNRLVGLARKTLRARPGLAAYDEDVALSAFKSLCLGAEAGRFPRLFDRGDLWRLLVVLTTRRAIDYMRRIKLGAGDEELDVEQVLSTEPSPDLAVELAEEFQHLLDGLPEAELRSVALWKLEGFTDGEIATRLGCVRRTVERKVRRIRSLWKGRVP
jgi:DNA-directed RNA polymerase specialized sigma24 family protein